MRPKSNNLSIMITDIQGYTDASVKSTRQDIIDLVRRHRNLLIPVIDFYHGTLIKTMGDAFLCTFTSATDAVTCAIIIQRILHEYNQQQREEKKRLRIRIVVNTGDVTIEDNDIYGDAVNITARMEGLDCFPGETIGISESTYLLMNRNEITANCIGPMELKGIPEPIVVYEVPLDMQTLDKIPARLLELVEQVGLIKRSSLGLPVSEAPSLPDTSDMPTASSGSTPDPAVATVPPVPTGSPTPTSSAAAPVPPASPDPAVATVPTASPDSHAVTSSSPVPTGPATPTGPTAAPVPPGPAVPTSPAASPVPAVATVPTGSATPTSPAAAPVPPGPAVPTSPAAPTGPAASPDSSDSPTKGTGNKAFDFKMNRDGIFINGVRIDEDAILGDNGDSARGRSSGSGVSLDELDVDEHMKGFIRSMAKQRLWLKSKPGISIWSAAMAGMFIGIAYGLITGYVAEYFFLFFGAAILATWSLNLLVYKRNSGGLFAGTFFGAAGLYGLLYNDIGTGTLIGLGAGFLLNALNSTAAGGEKHGGFSSVAKETFNGFHHMHKAQNTKQSRKAGKPVKPGKPKVSSGIFLTVGSILGVAMSMSTGGGFPVILIGVGLGFLVPWLLSILLYGNFQGDIFTGTLLFTSGLYIMIFGNPAVGFMIGCAVALLLNEIRKELVKSRRFR